MASKQDKTDLGLRVEFEHYKEIYRQEIQKSISFIGQDLEFFTRVKAQLLLDLTRRYVGEPSALKILDVGCGIGITDHYLTRHFRKLHGVDLSRGVVKKAAALNPKASYRHYAGLKLPYASNSMDVTFAICVMHHVFPGHLGHFVSEMVRVTKKGGMLAVFEHNPFNPLTRVAVSRCELDEDAVLLRRRQVAGLMERCPVKVMERNYILFTPFEGKAFRALDRALGWLPLGAQYYVVAQK